MPSGDHLALVAAFLRDAVLVLLYRASPPAVGELKRRVWKCIRAARLESNHLAAACDEVVGIEFIRYAERAYAFMERAEKLQAFLDRL